MALAKVSWRWAGSSAAGVKRDEGGRADRGRGRDAAPPLTPRGRAACGAREVVAQAGEVGGQLHHRCVRTMGPTGPGVSARVAAAGLGTRTGNSRVSEPSPGRPLILQ